MGLQGFEMVRLTTVLLLGFWLLVFVPVAPVQARVFGSFGQGEYSTADYRKALPSGRFLPTRPADVDGNRIRRVEPEGGTTLFAGQELPPGRFAPRRPGESARHGTRSASTQKRFEPTRPGQVLSRRADYVGTALDTYRKLGGNEVSSDFQVVEPWIREIEGSATRKAKKALWKKLVKAPFKLVFKTGRKAVWKVAVGSWVPLL